MYVSVLKILALSRVHSTYCANTRLNYKANIFLLSSINRRIFYKPVNKKKVDRAISSIDLFFIGELYVSMFYSVYI